MKTAAAIDTADFERLLSRNIKLPLLGGLFGAVVFVALILYLLSTIAWVEHTDQVVRSASELQRRSIDMETGMRGFLISGQDRFLEPYDAALARVKTDTAALRQLVGDNPQQIERVDRIGSLQGAWNEFAAEMIAARRSGGDFEAAVKLGRGKRLTDDIRNEFDNFINTEQSLRFQRNAEVKRTSWMVVGLFLLFTLTLSGLVAFFGRRQLVRLSESYDAVLQEQEAHTERLTEQAWLRTAQTELVGELVGELSAADMGRKILAFFSRHLGSTVGALYVRERHGPLRRAASYGFSIEAENAQQVFSPSESLVGQAAAEKRLMLIDPVEADYLKVNSGLGEMRPRAVVLLPVANDGVSNGVVELGLPGTPDQRARDLFEVVAEDIGTSLAAARYREQLQEVLAETQQLNEELQVQQEELRTANEELEEQSRALRASQAMLENQQAELEQTNSQLSERTEALDQRNTALRRAQRDLEERADELQRASRYKSEFLANMSHELRTPLNSALILAKLLGDNPQGNLSTEQVKFAESIYASGNDLLVLINDILDIAKVEAGKLDLVTEDTRLDRLAQALESTFRPLADEKRLNFRLELHPAAPASLVTDRQRVEQILKNLLSNALKFTEQGEVSLVISGTADGGASFAVSDSGIGIAPHQQGSDLRGFPPGRRHDQPPLRRHRPGPVDLARPHAAAGRHAQRAERAGPGQHLHPAPAGPGAAGRAAGTGQHPVAAARGRRAGAPAAARAGAGRAPCPGRAGAGGARAAVRRRPRAAARPGAARARDRGRTAVRPHPLRPRARARLPLPGRARRGRRLCAGQRVRARRDPARHAAARQHRPGRAAAPEGFAAHAPHPDPRGLGRRQRRGRAAHGRGGLCAQARHARGTHARVRAARGEAHAEGQDRAAGGRRRPAAPERDPADRRRRHRDRGRRHSGADCARAAAHARSFDCVDHLTFQLPDMPRALRAARGAERSTRPIVSFPPVIVYTGREPDAPTRRQRAAALFEFDHHQGRAKSPERLLDEVSLFLHQVVADLLARTAQGMIEKAAPPATTAIFEGRTYPASSRTMCATSSR